jgi:GxxExxY protein
MSQKRQDFGQATAQLVERELTGRIIECFFTVYNTFDFGMLEGVYRNALAVELSRHGLNARTEVPIEVMYRGVDVGFFRIDLLVEGKVAVEVKATELLAPTAKRQLLNYLRVSDLDVGLLLHFGLEPKFHRLVSPRIVRMREERILPLP